MLNAKRGYQLFFDLANEHLRAGDFLQLGRSGTKRYRFGYEFIWREDNSDPRQHAEEVDNLIKQDKVHFLGGSHPDNAEEQMKQTSNEGILDFYCCVGPDALYEQNFPTVFGMHVSNKEYTRMTIQRLSLEGVKKLWIVSDEISPFTRTTCKAAFDFAMDFADSSDCLANTTYIPFEGLDNDPNFFTNITQVAKQANVEAIVACLMQDTGKALVDAVHDAQYPLKAFFLTLGPTSQDWVDDFDQKYRADSILSAAQWHKEMMYVDDFFGDGSTYTELYQDKFNGTEPSYVSASASATGLTLHLAIKDAFQHCDISLTNGNVDELLQNSSAISCEDKHSNKTGYERVLEALAATDMEIFFGHVRFNMFRRNIGLMPVTTQVLSNKQKSSDEEEMEIKAVLPLRYATSLIRFPAENYYKDECRPGYYVGPDPFDRCKQCEKGSISFVSNSSDCDSCPLGTYINKTGWSECLPCPNGTTTWQRGSTAVTDCSCLRNFYNPFGQIGETCYPCPEGAVCEGGSEQPYPLKGFWMSLRNRNQAYPCDPADLCLGGPEFECRRGNTGRLCQDCADEYFHLIDHCFQCPNGTLIVFIIIGLLVGWYVINVIVSRSVVSLELMLGWAQLANIIGDVDLNWTEILTRMFGVANVLDFDVDILEPNCLIKEWGFKQNFMVQLCLPFVMSLMAGIGFLSALLIFYLIDKKILRLQGKGKRVLSWFVAVPESTAELEKKWDLTIATFLASVDITYVTIAKYCFDVFCCETVDGVSVLKAAPEVACSNDYHTVLVVLSSIGIALYVFGYLVCTSWIVLSFWRKKSFCEERNIRRYGFIYQKFELEYYYTPIIIILRKLLFVMVLVFLNDPAFQIGALAIIINVSLMIHIFTAPYVDTYIDVLFSVLLVALMFESFGGLMFYSDNLPQENRAILEGIVMATFYLLILVFVVIFIMEMATKYHIYQIKKVHRQFVLDRLRSTGSGFYTNFTAKKGIFETAVSFAANVCKRDDLDISYELVDTFKPSFVNKCLQKNKDLVEEWEKLTNMLDVYMSDQSPTSYLSVEQNAKFWRKMVDRFPEIVDYLAVVDEDTREQFKIFAQNLYKDFYLTNKVVSLPLMKILNWRDRAPMAHWLATASERDRDCFLRTISNMYRTIGQDTTANILDAKKKHGGTDPNLESRLQACKISGKRRVTLNKITAGSSPLDHPALGIANAATVALGVQRFRQGNRRPRQQQLTIELPLSSEVQPTTETTTAAAKEEQAESTSIIEITSNAPSSNGAARGQNQDQPMKPRPVLNNSNSGNSDIGNNESGIIQSKYF
eukprot:g2264.t1